MLTVRQSIITDAETRKVYEELLSLPGRIREAQDSFEETELQVSMFKDDAEAKAKVEELEGEAYFEARETIECGEDDKPVLDSKNKPKKKYANEEQRKIAVRMICNSDQEYIDAMAVVCRASRQKAGLKMELGKKINTIKFLTNQYYGFKAVAGLVAGLSTENVDYAELQAFAKVRALIKEFEGESNHG